MWDPRCQETMCGERWKTRSASSMFSAYAYPQSFHYVELILLASCRTEQQRGISFPQEKNPWPRRTRCRAVWRKEWGPCSSPSWGRGPAAGHHGAGGRQYEGGGGEGSEGEARGQGLVSAVRGGGEDPGGHGWEEHTGGAERGQI